MSDDTAPGVISIEHDVARSLEFDALVKKFADHKTSKKLNDRFALKYHALIVKRNIIFILS